jgi:hypothetical protein
MDAILSRETALLAHALYRGCELVEAETDSNTVWTWRSRDGRRWPRFLRRSQAIAYMAEWLDRGAA